MAEFSRRGTNDGYCICGDDGFVMFLGLKPPRVKNIKMLQGGNVMMTALGTLVV